MSDASPTWLPTTSQNQSYFL